MKQSKYISAVFSDESATEPVSLTEAKNHLYIDTANTDFDSYLTTLIKQCREYIEQITAVSLISRTVTFLVDYESNFVIPWGPVTSFTAASVKTAAATYDGQTLNEDYELEGGRFYSYTGTPLRYKLIYVAGYTSATIPHGLKLGILNEIARRFEHRGDNIIINDTNALVEPYKMLEWLM